ncbi:bifunctional phosphoribosylaminoimidazolecarboxamide formyltransferase/IMP cyclohydrolase [Methanosarcina sp. Z-7115]|uniref:Bifunctional phosphoribosylaminoimidazolecarboxamide formyltransferase/IMP cyclohydrolase n=1 Tax=Methanosarcina baikalica TaxID=3073890 RepID=A0ABU2CYS0_9EURY|nr:bifunctional phosphoribosylaminoimidazolecarboxamide formyltransferase/IMP cyclohydrolase [Methanosarcina sp. Z-7115]MDR7664885.1 bifunctional phosphoribosylaminoimidazolecarboxamide formyltransferase/IMP cyclohydrolase [Methanosarcina sp. Z-7115]
MVKRALLSVSNKTGIAEFARGLESLGVKIISTGGTAKILRDAGIEVTDVSEVTGCPEMMGGRVKTLHPRIHGGLLCLRESEEQMEEAAKEEISLIDMVAVNLYPFEVTVSRKDVEFEEAIENIDIGGPTLLRSAAKNYRSVTVLSDPSDYGHVLKELRSSGIISDSTRATLAVKAFRHTADYDAAIDTYLSKTLLGEEVLRLKFTDGMKLRYGENWHQKAYFYKDPKIEGPSLAKAAQLHGKELSYNNYVDADNALQTVKELGNAFPAVAIVKHNNPCGLATGSTLLQALQAAWDGDPISAYGSIICTNEIFDLEAATFLNGKFVEIILAPDFKPDALEYLKNKSENLRLLKLPELREIFGTEYTYKYIIGGMLKQSRDIGIYEKWESVTDAPYPEDKRSISEFCLKACKATKSNAVILAHEYESGFFMVLAMGAGQPNRVDSIRKLAATKAIENLRTIYKREHLDVSFEDYCQKVMSECVMASDAFFPFDDSIIYAAENNIRYIVSPGGSIRDGEVIATANRLGVAMIFTGMRHFLH